jgi:hypothetical protein
MYAVDTQVHAASFGAGAELWQVLVSKLFSSHLPQRQPLGGVANRVLFGICSCIENAMDCLSI